MNGFKPSRRTVLQVALAAGLADARAETYPSKPIRLVVGFAAGGPTDAAARVIAPELSNRLGQQVMVDNRPGAGGVIGVDVVARSAADGYTLGMLAVTSVLSEALNERPFDARRIAPISLMYDQYTVLVINPAVPGLDKVRNLVDLLAVARATPGGLNFTSAGHGSMGHLMMAWVCSIAGVQMNHVPYKGAAPALQDIMAGQLGVMAGDSTSAAPYLRSGKLRAVAVAYPKRVSDLPDVPTLAEQGYPMVSGTPWVILFGPPGLPVEIGDRVRTALAAVYAQPEMAERLSGLKLTPRTTSAESAQSMIASDYANWKKVIADNQIRAN
jgi:tripartite-type tricarboxylate transporter receptor subunit TctC